MTTFSEIYPQFLDDMAALRLLSENTLRAYRYELQAAAQDARFQIPLDSVTLVAIEAWISRHSVSASTISRRASTFSRFFAWAVRHGVCKRNPLVGRLPTRLKRRLPRPIHSQRALVAIDEAITGLTQPYRLIFIILRETGMRVSEVLDLRKGDVYLMRGSEFLHVRDPKNRIERTVILGPTSSPRTLRGLRAHLKTLRATSEQEVLFRSNRGTPVSYDAVHYQWGKLCKRIGLVDAESNPLYTLHQLRHTRGSELVAQGHPIEIVQRILGHRDIRSTLLYTELTEAQVRSALEQPKK
jgi:integrase/recombinase XerD